MSMKSGSTKTTKQSNSKKPKSLFVKILRIVGGVVLGIIALILVLVVYLIVDQELDKSRQRGAFSAATAKCGHKPVVVIEDVGYLLGGSTSYYALTPENSDYNEYKAIVDDNPLGYKKVFLYACSVEEAKSQVPELESVNWEHI